MLDGNFVDHGDPYAFTLALAADPEAMLGELSALDGAVHSHTDVALGPWLTASHGDTFFRSAGPNDEWEFASSHSDGLSAAVKVHGLISS